MGFYEMADQKQTPLPVAYKQIPLVSKEVFGEEGSRCLSCGIKFCCCSLWSIMILCLVIPYAPVALGFDARAQALMTAMGTKITGVEVDVARVGLLPGLVTSVADIVGLEVANPTGYKTPFFMKCGLIRSEVGMAQLLRSHLSFVEVQTMTIQGLTVYIDQSVDLPKVASMPTLGEVATLSPPKTRYNGKDLKEHCKRWSDATLMDQTRKYLVRRMDVQDMKVHIYMNNLPVKEISVPPMVVRDIGVKQGGVSFKELFDLITQSLSVVGLQGEVWSASNRHII